MIRRHDPVHGVNSLIVVLKPNKVSSSSQTLTDLKTEYLNFSTLDPGDYTFINFI